jgi:transcriptional regulator of arginine metabolism
MTTMPTRPQRHAEILRLIRGEAIPSQERLRERLEDRGFEVTQATLSRDLRSLGVVKVAEPDGGARYAVPAGASDPAPTLSRLMPALCTGFDGVGNLLIVKTLTGGAQPLAVAMDRQGWDEVVGTLAGDDTILVVTRSQAARQALTRRLRQLTDF